MSGETGSQTPHAAGGALFRCEYRLPPLADETWRCELPHGHDGDHRAHADGFGLQWSPRLYELLRIDPGVEGSS